MASRLVAQKGFKLIADALDDLLALPAQYILLGTGEEEFEKVFGDAAEANPTRFHLHKAYDIPFSHRLIAGSDMFLMPSLFEPCGLTQLYSLRYGTLPIVRRTGGLADSIIPYTGSDPDDATGFAFTDPTPEAMVACVTEAVNVYTSQQKHWNRLVSNAMACDFSWSTSALAYIDLYKKLAGSN
jgi:starch synthase